MRSARERSPARSAASAALLLARSRFRISSSEGRDAPAALAAQALGRTPLGGTLRLSLPFSLGELDPHSLDDPASALFAPAMGVFRRVRDHYVAIQFVSGVILVSLGAFLFAGEFWRLRVYVNRLFEALGLGS